MRKHTPAPWKVIPSIHSLKYRCVQIGTDESYTTMEMLPADARLISAAPDLLAAITEFIRLDEDCELQARDGGELVSALHDAHTAIRKATGAKS